MSAPSGESYTLYRRGLPVAAFMDLDNCLLYIALVEGLEKGQLRTSPSGERYTAITPAVPGVEWPGYLAYRN